MNTKKTQSKIFTIISHEYITRVKSKGFIIGTLLGPILMLAVIAIPAVVAYFSADQTEKKIAILDKTNQIGIELVNKDTAKYFLTHENESVLQKQVLSEELDGYLLLDSNVLTSGKATVFTQGGGGIGLMTSLESNVGEVVRMKKLRNAGASEEVIKLIDDDIDIVTKKITEKGTESDFTAIYAAIGYGMGFIIYILMFIYGGFVSRGVIEEKANRIVEVIASSVKPFEIMFGKVVGIGLVGLTQVSVWGIMMSVISMFGVQAASMAMGMPQGMPGGAGTGMPFEIPTISPWLVIGFVYYFLAGYFIYSTLFAALGSAVDQEQDLAQLQTPIMIPIIIPILFIFNVMSNPDGTLAIVLSLIPFFTPILMIVRVAATTVPIWQIVLSVVLTMGTFLACLWTAAKIYRVGILMYGKKPTFGDLFRWMKQS